MAGYDLYRSSLLAEFPERVKYQHSLSSQYYRFHKYEKTKQLMLEIGKADTISQYKFLPAFPNSHTLANRESGKYNSARYYLQILYREEFELVKPKVPALAAGNISSI